MEDLSSLVPGLTGDSSMGAVNTVSVTPPFGAPGSESESTRDDVVHEPGPVVPAERPRTVLHPSGEPRTDPWTRADGTPWRSSSGESSAGGETPGGAAPGGWQ